MFVLFGIYINTDVSQKLFLTVFVIWSNLGLLSKMIVITGGIVNLDPYLIFVISFTLAGFLKTKFYTKKTTIGTKNTKNVSEKVKYMHFFSLNLEKFTPDRKFLHRHVCGVCDK